MIDFLQQYNPVTQAFIATLFTWGVTAAGAALVLFSKKINQKFMDSMLGFAAGVMIAASFWSLLSPGIEMAEQLGQIPWLSAVIGFMGGGAHCGCNRCTICYENAKRFTVCLMFCCWCNDFRSCGRTHP